MKDLVVFLWNIRSIYNTASIFRTADALGVSKIYLCGITPEPIDILGNYKKDFSKVSLGAEKTVNWEYSYFTLKALKKVKKDGYRIIALEQSPKSKPYYKFKVSKNSKIALILGNEIKGLPKKILDFSDLILEIPMLGKKESLNVSIAFAVVGFYLRYNK
jgi:tRNA G18 (ribose-2'-O)-methylase SpoU